MYVVACVMGEGLAHLAQQSASLQLSTVGFVDDYQRSLLCARRDAVAEGTRMGRALFEAMADLGLKLNRGKSVVVSDHRPTALRVAHRLGIPALPRGMYKARNLGVDCAPLRPRRWVRTGSVF